MMIRKILVKFLNDQLSYKYGSPRGFIRTILPQFLNYFGWYRGYKNIEWDKVKRLVFVCKGNICRSAFAEAVARSLNMETVSCGIDTHDGKPANEAAIRVAGNIGYKLGEHKTTKITSLEIKEGDLFIAMEPCQVKFIENLLNDQCMLTLMGLWQSPYSPYIHDPYGNSDAYVTRCFKYISKSVSEVANKIGARKY